jgi:hypothetical protein
LVFAACVHGAAEFHDHGFQVLGMDGRHPFLAGENVIAGGQAEKFEEQGGAADVAAHEIQIKDAEASRGLGEFEEIGGSAHAASTRA